MNGSFLVWFVAMRVYVNNVDEVRKCVVTRASGNTNLGQNDPSDNVPMVSAKVGGQVISALPLIVSDFHLKMHSFSRSVAYS